MPTTMPVPAAIPPLVLIPMLFAGATMVALCAPQQPHAAAAQYIPAAVDALVSHKAIEAASLALLPAFGLFALLGLIASTPAQATERNRQSV